MQIQPPQTIPGNVNRQLIQLDNLNTNLNWLTGMRRREALAERGRVRQQA